MENYNLKNAINIFNLSNRIYTVDEIKDIYRKLASANHPDKGGSTEVMQLINISFDELLKFFATTENLEVKDSLDNGTDFKFIDTLKKMSGVVIEVCGYWVWLTGNTVTHKDSIKELGFRFSAAKKAWYWFPMIDSSKFRRGSKSMKVIRSKYGSSIINNEPNNYLDA